MNRERSRRVGSYAFLLSMLFVWMFVYPLFHNGEFKVLTVGHLVFAGLLIASVRIAAGNPKAVRSLSILAVLIVVVGFLHHFGAFVGQGVFVAIEVARVVFILLGVHVVFRHIMRSESVSLDTILGAICVFLMIAAAFAEAYRVLDVMDPNAIQYLDDSLSGDLPAGYTHDRYTYFSVVTITTLGYGDVVPISSLARMLVQIEAILGQLYVALVLAWLVGLNMTQYTRSKQRDATRGDADASGQ